MSQKTLPTLGIIAFSIAAATSSSFAQLPNTELHTVYPHVANAGQTVEISLTGLNLDELTGLQFSDPRIKAEPVMLPESEFRKYPAQDGTKFKVTIPADFPPGTVETRSIGLFGLSTSRPFEIVGKDTPLVADAGAVHHKLETAPELPLEAFGYGRTDANKIDYWKFTAKKDQRLLIHCRSEWFDAKTDATLVVVDKDGKKLEHNRDHDGRDPMIDFTAPADGQYFVGVHDFIYNGGADYPYTLTISAKPEIDFVFPPAGQPGQVTSVTLFGRNLPGGSPGEGLALDGKPIETVTAQITIPTQPTPVRFDPSKPDHGILPGFDYRHENSNAVRIGFAKDPVIAEDPAAESQTITIPCEIAGRFDETADSDRYRFTAKKDTTYWVEAIGDRLGGKTDPYIVVEKITKPAEGPETFAKVKDGDDDPGKGGVTFQDGSRDTAISFTAAADGDYQVTIVNQFASGGIDKIYRLGIREAKPDFQVLAIAERPYHDANQLFSAAPLLRQGGTAPLKIVIKREDGFDQPVTVAAEGMPAGVTCPPLTIAGNDDMGYLVFQATPDAATWAGTIKVTGKAKIGAADVAREARLGTMARGVTNKTTEVARTRLDTQIPLAVSAEEKAPVLIELADPAKPLVVEVDQKLDIPIKLTNKNNLKGNLTIIPADLRGMVKPVPVNIAEDKAEGVVSITFKNQANVFNVEPGTYSFVLQGKGTQAKYRHNPQAAERAAEEQKLADELAAKYTAEAAKAKTDAAAAKAEFDKATAAVTTATAAAKAATDKATAAAAAAKAATDKAAAAAADAKAALTAAAATATAAKTAADQAAATANAAKAAAEKALADAKIKNDAAIATAAEIEKKRVAADAAKKAAPAKVKAATDKAKEKDIKFAAYSLPITVEVKPKPEPEKK